MTDAKEQEKEPPLPVLLGCLAAGMAQEHRIDPEDNLQHTGKRKCNQLTHSSQIS